HVGGSRLQAGAAQRGGEVEEHGSDRPVAVTPKQPVERLEAGADLAVLRVQVAQLVEVLGKQAWPPLRQEGPPPRPAVAMVAVEALVEERPPRLREPLVEVVEADLV